MDEMKGKFICPICQYNGILWNDLHTSDEKDFKNWLSKKEYKNNKLEKHWVIYGGNENKQKKWICCSCCGDSNCCCGENIKCKKFWSFALKCEWCKEGGCNQCNALDIICFPFCYLFFYLFYILFFVWADIFNYCCDCKKKYYFVGYPLTLDLRGFKFDFFDELDKSEIWNASFSEEIWKRRKPWKCNKCKYTSEDFTYFIQKKDTDQNKTNENIYLKTEELNLDSLMMSVLFTSGDGNINYSILCKKTDIFSEIEKKLYDEFPEYKNKNCFFLQGGNIIDKNETLENNKIQAGYPIIVNC